MKPPAPARVALVAGERNAVIDYDRGRVVAPDRPLTMVPVMPRPEDTAAPAMVEGIMLRPARLMDEGTAVVTLRNMVENCKVWTKDFPYPAPGEAAEALRFFHDLRTRQQARLDASAYGGEVMPEAEGYVPPTQATAALNKLRSDLDAVLEIFGRALQAAGVTLVPSDRQLATKLRQAIIDFEI